MTEVPIEYLEAKAEKLEEDIEKFMSMDLHEMADMASMQRKAIKKEIEKRSK